MAAAASKNETHGNCSSVRTRCGQYIGSQGIAEGLPAIIYRDCYARQAALGLAQRFVHGGKEADGSPTRDRLKLMPRVVNVEEWARTAPLSGPVSLPTMHCPRSVRTPGCMRHS